MLEVRSLFIIQELGIHYFGLILIEGQAQICGKSEWKYSTDTNVSFLCKESRTTNNYLPL